MCRYILAAAFAVVLGGAELQAAVRSFRSGDVLAAELSSQKPEMLNESAMILPDEFPQKIYAAVTVSVDPGRALTVHDYALEGLGQKYKCVAVRAGESPFDGNRRQIADADFGGDRRATMLFVLDGMRFGHMDDEELSLVSLFPPAHSVNIPFVNRKAQPLSAPSAIPAGGAFQLPLGSSGNAK